MNQDRPARMRAPLKWGLAGTALATAASLLWPTHELVGAQDREGKSIGTVPAAPQGASAMPMPDAREGGLTRLQPLIESNAASAAVQFDPFVGLVPPPPPSPPPVAPPVVVAAPPAPPAQDYRFLGRMTDPDGIEQTLLGRGDAAIPVKAGTALDNGYVVESITADAIVLAYPPLGTKITLSIPKP